MSSQVAGLWLTLKMACTAKKRIKKIKKPPSNTMSLQPAPENLSEARKQAPSHHHLNRKICSLQCSESGRRASRGIV